MCEMHARAPVAIFIKRAWSGHAGNDDALITAGWCVGFACLMMRVKPFSFFFPVLRGSDASKRLIYVMYLIYRDHRRTTTSDRVCFLVSSLAAPSPAFSTTE